MKIELKSTRFLKIISKQVLFHPIFGSYVIQNSRDIVIKPSNGIAVVQVGKYEHRSLDHGSTAF